MTCFRNTIFVRRNIIVYKNIVAALLLLTVLSGMALSGIVLSGCGNTSVDPSQITIPRTTNKLRLIQDGDYTEFKVTGTFTDPELDINPTDSTINLVTGTTGYCEPKVNTTTTAFNGTLRIDWSAAQLTQPFSGGAMLDVMKQVTTLTLDITPPGTVTTTEYISQDPTTGSVTLHAFDGNPGLSQYYWVSNVADLGSINNPVVLPSPLPANGTNGGTYFVNQGCDGNSACTQSIRSYTNNLTFTGENIDGLKTALGKFNPLSYVYLGSMLDTNSPSVLATLDMRGFCDTQNAFFKGVAWVLPEVGLLELDNSCASNTIQSVDMNDPAVVNAAHACSLDPGSVTNNVVPVYLIKAWDFKAEISATNIPLPSN